MKKILFSLLLCSLALHAHAQLGKISKDLNQASNDVKSAGKSVGIGNKPASGTSNSATPAGNSAAASAAPAATGRDWYVCAATGKGQNGTKDQPAKDLGAIAHKLQPGDRILIAEGSYTSRADEGADVLEMPLSIIGGWDSGFNTRDPWGRHKTIMTGTNEYMKSSLDRIAILTDKAYKDWDGEILIDGLIIDNGSRNRYTDEKQLCILRKAKPEAGQNPSPESAGIKIRTGQNTRVIIRNCVIMNTAPTQGALDLQVNKNGSALVENNLIINNTGEGVMCKSNWHSTDGLPEYTIRNNTILFCWKHDAVATYGGNCIMMDTDVKINIENNILGFGDFGGVNNIKQCKTLTLKGNIFLGHKKYDYKEFNTPMKIDEIEDYARFIVEAENNTTALLKFPMPAAWSETYLARKDISREELDASVKVSNSANNQVRGILGLPLQGSAVKIDAEIWLHRLLLSEIDPLKFQASKGAGCSAPKA